MEGIDIEEQDPFPVDRDGTKMGGRDQIDGNRKRGCCDRFQHAVSKWMLPEDSRGTYLERANCCPPPIFIILISIAELAMFIYYAVWKPQKQWVTLEEGIWKSPLTYKPDLREEAWRFVSYMFVHAGVEHILGNLVLQLVLGIPLELVHKGFEVGMVYMAGVLAELQRDDSSSGSVPYPGHSGSCWDRRWFCHLQKICQPRRWFAGVFCGSYRRRGGRNDHRLRLLQLLQQEAAQRPAFLVVHRGLCNLPALCCALQYLPVPSIIGPLKTHPTI
ncbi:rhomboid-related protein 2 isoform 2-T2 [Polymixia lowei]